MRREQKDKKEAKERYWKVRRSSARWLTFCLDLILTFCACLCPRTCLRTSYPTRPLYKLHAQGKTDEAKADLSRLAKIRAEREAAAAKRKAEAEGEDPMLVRLIRILFCVLVRRESQGVGGCQSRAI